MRFVPGYIPGIHPGQIAGQVPIVLVTCFLIISIHLGLAIRLVFGSSILLLTTQLP